MLVAHISPVPLILPMLASAVSAGFPSPAEDHVEDDVDLHELLDRNRAATFLVRVKGSSMIDVLLGDGDIAVVDRSVPPSPGDIVVIDVDGDRSFKIWTSRREAPLAFANRALAPYQLPLEALVEIWGTVTGSVCARRRAHLG